MSSRYCFPVLRPIQGRYSLVTSSKETFIAGRLPRPQPRSSGLCLQPPSATHPSHSANVTSRRPTANAISSAILRTGFSSASPPVEPIANSPEGTTIISGQAVHSLNTSFCLSASSSDAERGSGGRDDEIGAGAGGSGFADPAGPRWGLGVGLAAAAGSSAGTGAGFGGSAVATCSSF